MTRPPLIGISAYSETVAWDAWTLPSILIPRAYTDAVLRVGGQPVLIPPGPEAAESLIGRLNGLILSGGPDLSSSLYGVLPDPHTGEPQSDRDSAELALAKTAVEKDIPVLGICRGMQVLNVALGGDLVQHLPNVVKHERHGGGPGSFSKHRVTLKADSILGGALGSNLEVSSHHHQAPGHLGDGLKAVAWAEDETVEAIELNNHRYCVGVLWHPEIDEDDALFSTHISASLDQA